jgi:3-oxoadipate enol-lactonase
VTLAWESFGDGPPVLFIHGLGYDRAGWGPAPRILSEKFRVVIFDNRGVGESDAPSGPYTTEQMAADAATVLDAVGVERAHIVGTSLGGMIAQTFALAWPERVRSLVLSATTPGGADAWPMPEQSVRRFTAFAETPSAENLRGLVENALSVRTVALRPLLVEEIYAYRLEHRPALEPWMAQAAAANAFSSLPSLAGLSVPTLVTHGTDDNVVDYRNSELLAGALKHVESLLVPHTGHLGFWEKPEAFAAALSGFFGRHPG